MDRRSWPWKKKSSEAKNESLDLTSFSEEQRTRGGLDDSVISPQQHEERNRMMSEKLSLAVAEITTKDNLVKQHAKVAEEAVSGWEKAEKEAASLKKQLDASLQQKTFLENRLAHLEGALKECMRELRTVREEHDQKLQETLLRKSKEWDKVRQETESKLSSATDRFIESEAQKNALSRSLQERSQTISELTEAKALAQTEASVIQVRKEELEKAYSALKYEVQVLAKEVEIRNEEKDCNKKMAENASKQQLENVKKIAKLEAECQRLKGLVRKKLPGPGAMAQMRMEVDGHSRTKVLKVRGFPNSAASADSVDEVSQDSDELSERFLAMEEETKMLKEALTKKNQELQSARLMCAKTASKLSLVEEQLDRAQGSVEAGCKSRFGTGSPASSDSWASALVAQLEQFKKGKEGSYSEKLFESSNFDLMDDFAEIERLATTSSTSTTASESGAAVHDERVSYEEALSRKERECCEVRELCEELKKKLLSAEEQIANLELRIDSNGHKEQKLVTDMDRIFAEARDRWALRKVTPADNTMKEKLRSAVSNLIQLVESLAQSQHVENGKLPEDEMKRLISSGDDLLQGKEDVLDFIGKLSSVLSSLQAKFSATEVVDASSSLDGSDGDAECNKWSFLQEDNAKLKSEKATMEQEFELANEKIERLKAQLSGSEQLVSNLRVELASMEASKQLAENELTVMASIKSELESKVRASCVEMGRLQDTITALESELHNKRQQHEQVSNADASHGSSPSPNKLSENAARLQEQEIAAAAEKLADCQRTIIALGKQLHSFSVPPGSSRGSMDFSDVSESSAERTQLQSFPLKSEQLLLQSDSDEEDSHKWKIQRSASDMSRMKNTPREKVRKQEIYWSSALSPEPAGLDNGQSAAERSSYKKPGQDGEFFAVSPVEDRSSSKNSGFSRFFHRRASLH